MQLKHAIQMQTHITTLQRVDSTLVKEVTQRKGMISWVYMNLPSTIQDPANLKSRVMWVDDVEEVSGELWHMALESIPLISHSASHKLTQLFILHQVYKIPDRLFQWGKRGTTICYTQR